MLPVQAQNLQRSKAYKANKLDEALVASYLRIDDIMRTQSHLLDLEKQKGEHTNDNLIGMTVPYLIVANHLVFAPGMQNSPVLRSKCVDCLSLGRC